MPTTTRQLSKIAKISEQSVRNYTREYAELLSPAARGESGPRLFSDEDVQTICTVATLRREGVPPAEVIERLRRGDVYIDTTTDQNRPHQATPSPQEGQGDALMPLAVQSSMVARLDSVERRLDTRDRQAMLWHIGTGVWIGMVLMAAIFFAVGLLTYF